MKAIIQAAEVAVAEAKNYLEALYNNDTVSLEEKWEAFKAAPNYLKNHEGWIVRFESVDDDLIGYNGGAYHAERHQVVRIDYLIDSLEDYNEENPDQAVDINAFKQEVLKKNLGSFEYDW